jgi:hypothetical protein
MYVLQAAITADLGTMPFEHLIAVMSFLLVLISVIFINGFSLKLGEKEIHIGGIRKLLAKKDEDTLLKESLKRFSDDVDHDIEADLYELIEDMDTGIERIALRKHCYFTFDKFQNIIKSELYKRVRRNNLRERLSVESRDKYVSKLLRDIEEKYQLLQAKVSVVKCGDSYAQFPEIRETVKNELYSFFDNAIKIIVSGYKRKIEKYKDTKDQFKTASARKFCCDDCIAKNKQYIKNLAGEEVKT